MFTCPNCAQVEELRELRKQVSSSMENLEEIQLHGFDVLQGRLSEVASVLEWGFEQVGWELEQQTNVLKDIDHTLKTPSETQANEWRQIAEELRNRGDLPKALEFFLKAHDTNPLDYRTYIGATHAYLRMGDPDSAVRMLTSSLLHAPKNYYRAYSRRLLGHVYACREDYGHARDELALAIRLAPDYVAAHYDHAQYSALIGNQAACLHSLETAVAKGGERYFRLAQSERNFAPFRNQVNDLLQGFYQKAWEEARLDLTEAETELARSEQSLTAAETSYYECRKKTRSTPGVSPSTIRAGEYERAIGLISVAKKWMEGQDYGVLAKVREHAQESLSIARMVRQKADRIQADSTARIADHDTTESRKGVQAVLALMVLVTMFVIVVECGSGDPDSALSTGNPSRPPQQTTSPNTQSPAPTVAPILLKWHTFLGGEGRDSNACVVAGDGGSIFVAGESDQAWGSPERAFQRESDAFVAKLDFEGSLAWNTFLGGDDKDEGKSVAVDTSGCVYVVGESDATWDSPIREFQGGRDAFVAKLWPEDGSLIWHSFLGGHGRDGGQAVAVDTSDCIYVLGQSDATWGSPVKPLKGDGGLFVAKLDVNGQLLWHAFVGNSGGSAGLSINVDSVGNSYIAGCSDATWGTPVQAHHGDWDAFVAKLDSDGNPVWHTFLGCDGTDLGQSVKVDTHGDVYVCGYSAGSWGSPLQPYGSADTRAFVAKLNTAGRLVWHTFVGSGNQSTRANGLVVDEAGYIHLAGIGYGTWGSPVQPFNGGNTDAFVVKLDGAGRLVWHTFVGGTESDHGYGLAVDPSGNIHLLSGSSSASWGSPERAFSGGDWDAFIARLG